MRKTISKLLSALALVCVVVSYQNCGGGFSASLESSGSNLAWQDSGYSLNPATKFTCSSPASRGIAQKSFRRLTKSEIISTVGDLFGASVRSASAVDVALTTIPNESPGDLVHELVNAHSFNQVSSFMSLAEAITTQVFSSQGEREKFFGTCSSATTITEACVRQFLVANGARLVRRMPSAARQTELVGMYNKLGGGIDGLKGMLTVLLQTPEFIFHVEAGRETPLVNSGRMALSDYEVANRISYAITGSMPDATLFAEAGKGALRTVTQVRAQTERLIKSTAARSQFEALLDSWLGTDTIQDPNSILAAKVGISTAGFATEARRELMDYALYMVFDRDASLPALLSAKIGFPKSDRMAKIYGSSLSRNNAPVDLPNGHGGLLLRASVLVKGTMASSPILRGVAVRKRLLCETLPSPDFSIVSTRTTALDSQDTSKLSNREVTSVVTAGNACMGCHTLINPIGFTMEKFDSLGMVRQYETVWNADGTVKGTHPIDTAVKDPNLESGGAQSFGGSDDLMESIAGSTKARACASERLFSTTRIRPLDSGDSCAASEIEQSILKGASVKSAWIQSIANEDILWRRDNP